MKAAVIIYHKNVHQIYKKEWVEQCLASIKNQTYQDFSTYELNYGNCNTRLCDGEFAQVEMHNHIFALNWLLDTVFALGFDVAFNINLDDHYHPARFIKQIAKINQGYQLVSSNFRYFGEKEKEMNMAKYDIKRELMQNHNVIAHPCVAMHRTFWGGRFRYNENSVGFEDLELWKYAILKGKKFSILPDYLLHYRIHKNQVTQEYGINGKKIG